MNISVIKGLFSAGLFALNTLFWSFFLYVFLIFKLLIPFQKSRAYFSHLMARIGELWISGNDLNIALTQKIKWNIQLPDNLSMNKSYLVCANHQSWVDIVVLQHVFNRKIPFLRFFLKQELLYVPVLGGAWWALDYPFMKRYTKEYLEKHPEKRGQDLATTIKATEKFKHSKVSILNFLEGTRFTPEKHTKQNSPFQHLILPKAGGFAFVLEAMKGKFNSILDVTIIYPKGAVSLWEAFSGHLQEVVVLVREISVPAELLNGNYLDDPQHREKFQSWIRKLWSEKDLLISRTLQQ
jgi:1-acyl-sn-glycerol-3-phosphate acyltransferase